jgi:hypothetical protein
MSPQFGGPPIALEDLHETYMANFATLFDWANKMAHYVEHLETRIAHLEEGNRT